MKTLICSGNDELINIKKTRKQTNKTIDECMITPRFILKPFMKISDQVNYSGEILQKIPKPVKQKTNQIPITENCKGIGHNDNLKCCKYNDNINIEEIIL